MESRAPAPLRAARVGVTGVLWRAFFGLILATGLALGVWARTGPAPPEATRPAEAVTRVLVLRSGPDSIPGRLHAVFAANLAGRFGRAEIRTLEAYRPGDLKAYDATVVLAAARTDAAALQGDLKASGKPALWLSTRDGTEVGEGPATVLYKGQTFTRDPSAGPLARLRLEGPGTETLASADGAPWAVRQGRQIAVAETPLDYVHEDDRYLVLADLMFELLAPGAPERRRALVRIEDVGPEADPARLRRIADLLHARGVPFSVAVYDSYRDPGGRFASGVPMAFTLRKRPGVAEALAYMAARGGTLVMHGHTHQTDQRPNPYARVSGGDYEFFAAGMAPDGAFDLQGPLPVDDVEAWGRRLDEGMEVWRDVGLPAPTVFTTPHYAASRNADMAIRRRFRVRYERPLYFVGDESGDWGGQFMPYEVRDVRGDLIVPENLGYFTSARGPSFGRNAAGLVELARRNLVVRDGYASFFFHWFEDARGLEQAVDGIRGLGYRFVSPAEVVAEAGAGRLPAGAPGPVPLWVRLYRLADADGLVALLVLTGSLGLLLEVAWLWLVDRRGRRQEA
jgi:hypothetical protein